MLSFLKKWFERESIDLKGLINRGAIIVDVRSPKEFSGGHVKGAINLPLGQISQQIETLKEQQKPVITCCKSGMRSEMASLNLKSAGIEAYNAGQWQNVQKSLQNT